MSTVGHIKIQPQCCLELIANTQLDTKVADSRGQHILHQGCNEGQSFKCKCKISNYGCINWDWQRKWYLKYSLSCRSFCVINLPNHSWNVNKIYVQWTRKEILELYISVVWQHFITLLRAEPQKDVKPPSTPLVKVNYSYLCVPLAPCTYVNYSTYHIGFNHIKYKHVIYPF